MGDEGRGPAFQWGILKRQNQNISSPCALRLHSRPAVPERFWLSSLVSAGCHQVALTLWKHAQWRFHIALRPCVRVCVCPGILNKKLFWVSNLNFLTK